MADVIESVPDADKKKHKTTQPSERERPMKLTKKEEKPDICQLQAGRINDGRKCTLCPSKDTDLDPVMMALGLKCFLAWSAIWPNMKTKSYFCYYCVRVWQKRYRHLHTMVIFCEMCQKDDALHKKFRDECVLLQDYCIKNRRIDSYAPWADFEKKLTMREIKGVEVLEDEEMVPWDKYLEQEDDPSVNGKVCVCCYLLECQVSGTRQFYPVC